jgi:tRNA nucleotidyltransferase/poly(A) polymerase
MAKQVEKFQFFEVGGCVRDSLLGIESNDIDFAVVPNEQFDSVEVAFEAMKEHLVALGFDPKKETSLNCEPHQFLTIRAKVSNDSPLKGITDYADFVLARKDGPYKDGRRPEWVKPGTLLDDLSRRDFKCNAIARAIDGTLIDPFDGQRDIKDRVISFVGNAETRVREDGLRILRAFRFEITKGFKMDSEAWDVVRSEFGAEMLGKQKVERVREELVKMFRADTLGSLSLLCDLPSHTRAAIFRDGLRLDATMKM